jgi:murein DD-endopeptidase MepM/ murein hydrolase activator NlpD
MSSHDQDRLVAGAPDAISGTGSTLVPARGRHRRPAGAAAEKARSSVPAQRQGTAQRSESTSTTASADSPARATAKAATAKASTAQATTVKATSAKAATARAGTTKAATAAKSAATAKAASAPKKAAAKTAPAAKKTASTKTASTPKPAAEKATPAQRPTPSKRAAGASAVVQPVEPPTALPVVVAPTEVAAPEATAPEGATPEGATPEVEAGEVVAALAGGRRPGLLRRRPPSIRRRPALYLAAAMVGAMSVGVVSAGDLSARAVDTASHSVSVADTLGVDAQPQTVTSADASHLRELAASRNQRGAAQAAAVQAQATANRNAVEAKKKAAELARPKAVLPVAGARLTSTFGMRWGVLHAGIDLAAPIGTPEYAAVDGIVLKAGPASGFGLAVYIQHANGDVTVYGHMEQILVQEGQVVRAGQTIALLGARGQATGPHLHLEVHVGGMMGRKIDPLPWLRARGVSV